MLRYAVSGESQDKFMAGRKSKTQQTRTLIAAAMTKATRKGGVVLQQLMAKVRSDNQKIIDSESDALIDEQMLAIARQYGNLRSGASSSVLPDLFGEYPMGECVTIFVVDKDGTTQSLLTPVELITLDQAIEHVASHKQTPKRSRRLLAMERAIKDLSPFGTGDSTFAECWKAKAAKAKKSG